MCLSINNDEFMQNKCYFLLNYRMHYCDDSATIGDYFRSLKPNENAHKILIAAQKFKKYKKKYKFVRFCKEIFDKDNFDKF